MDASVRSVVDGEELVILEMPRRLAFAADEVTVELVGQAGFLEGRYDEALRRFGPLN